MIPIHYLKNNLKIIVGAGGTSQTGFISTEIENLDIRRPKDWEKNFRKDSVGIILAEHVLEHLSKRDLLISLKQCYQYLRKGGFIRIAIPDKNRRDKIYLKEVKPPSDGHKTFFDLSELTEILNQVGFKVCPLEYHDKHGSFYINSWRKNDGFIKRSYKNDKQKKFWNGKYYYTSLIVDAVKPFS